jgi:hypothetical protein
MLRFLALLLLAFLPVTAHAQKNAPAPKPGTVGYLFEDCAAALEKSATPKEFLTTYCGGFVEGYGMGVLVSTPPPIPEPNEKDPCRAEKQEAFDRINGRLCSNLPDYRDSKTPPGVILQAVTQIVSRWHGFLKENKKLSIMKKPAIQEINALILPGPFCDTLTKSGTDDLFIINPGLLSANWYDFVKGTPATLADKYVQCRKDLAEENFSQSRCAAEVTGFLAGLYSAAPLQKRDKGEGACTKEVDRLYESLDMTKTMCVGADTSPEKIAETFLEAMDAELKAGHNLKASGFGGAGYRAVYYGFMCKR